MHEVLVGRKISKTALHIANFFFTINDIRENDSAQPATPLSRSKKPKKQPVSLRAQIKKVFSIFKSLPPPLLKKSK